MSYGFKKYNFLPIPTGLSLSGTPLNEAMVALHQIIPQFKSENKVQKVQCVVLSDGEAGGLKYHREVQRRWESEPFLGTSAIHSNAFLRDRKTGNTYSFDCEWYEFTDILLNNLRDVFPDVNFIGIRVLEGGRQQFHPDSMVGVKVNLIEFKSMEKRKAFYSQFWISYLLLFFPQMHFLVILILKLMVIKIKNQIHGKV